MLETLIAATAALCVLAAGLAWARYKDVFHPLVLISPMFGFMYVYMPIQLLEHNELYLFVTEQQAIFYQLLILVSLAAFSFGCLQASGQSPKASWVRTLEYDPALVRRGGYLLGTIGLLAWSYAVQNAGGFTEVFSRPKGFGWSDNAYIREAAYLLVVGLLLLLSPQGYRPHDNKWRLAVVAFAAPYLIQGLLGAQRGPTFLAVATVGLSWYFARRKRPPLLLVIGGGTLLGFLMLFLVANRGAIYLGSQAELQTDVSSFFESTEANEYIFGAGCVTASRQTGRYFWGRRYLAQVVVRPIPSSVWPTKYHDFGVPELLTNAGVAVAGFEAVMGWEPTLGAAAGMVADVWVELSWLAIPVLGLIGWTYGYAWKRALWSGGPWITTFTILVLLSVYFVSQSGEAVIFRLIILCAPSYWAWSRAAHAPTGSLPTLRTRELVN